MSLSLSLSQNSSFIASLFFSFLVLHKRAELEERVLYTVQLIRLIGTNFLKDFRSALGSFFEDIYIWISYQG